MTDFSTRKPVNANIKFVQSCYINRDNNSYINSAMDTLKKAELTASIRHIARFSKSRIPLYNSEIPDTAGRKTRRRRRTQAIAKRSAFYANAITVSQ